MADPTLKTPVIPKDIRILGAIRDTNSDINSFTNIILMASPPACFPDIFKKSCFDCYSERPDK